MARRLMRAVLAGVLALGGAMAARAETMILRDPDIEHAIGELARPLVNAAGLSPSRLKVFVVADDRLNAFVVDGDHIFINSGLFLRLKTPAELQAVIAHELAHIANGHLASRAINARAAGQAAAVGLVLSVIAASAGGGDVAGGLLLGTVSSAHRVFLRHTRTEEASADLSAVRYMAEAGIDAEGMVEVLDIFRGQEALDETRRDPYMLTHPLTRDRMRAVQGFAAAAAERVKPRPDDAYWFARAQGKLEAFLRNPKTVLRRIAPGDTSDIAQLRRAVALHRSPEPAQAIAAITALSAQMPDDPYIAELEGQILLENRRFTAAIAAYGRAARIAPKDALILSGYGRALLAEDKPEQNRQALEVLERAYARDPLQPAMLRDLGLAYARAGQPGMASLAIAERYALSGRLKDAALHAKRALGLLPSGSSGWNRARDIIYAAETAQN